MSDWTTDAADAIDTRSALVRERTVEPVQAVARVVIYGLLAALIVDPGDRDARRSPRSAASSSLDQGNVWAAWLTLGGIFVVAGWFCWSKRNP